jgi:hypothetical protein
VVFEPLGHAVALLMSVGPHTTVPLLFCADIVKWGSLCVGDPVEETYRMTTLQRRGVGVADWLAVHQRWNGFSALYKPVLIAWLWSLHIDAPSLWSAAQFLINAVMIFFCTAGIDGDSSKAMAAKKDAKTTSLEAVESDQAKAKKTS